MSDDIQRPAGLQISIATSEAEREACCALRYRVYVEEQGRPTSTADHARKLDLSADDASGVLFWAHIDGKLVATVRLHHGAMTDIPAFIRKTCLLPPTGPLQTTATIGRLAVLPEHRGDTTTVSLFRACGAWLSAEGRVTDQLFIVAFDIPRLIAMYRLLGFKPVEPIQRHMSEIGPVIAMYRRLTIQQP